MSKQAYTTLIIVVAIVILFVALTSGSDEEDNGIKRGATSTVGEFAPKEDEETDESAAPILEEVNVAPEIEEVETSGNLNDEMANVEGIEVMLPEETGTSSEDAEPSTAEPSTAEPPAEEIPVEEIPPTLPPEPEPIVEEVQLGSLVLHYTFDEGSGTLLNDVSGYGNNGTLINPDVTVWQAGQIGGSIKFYATNDHAQTPHSDSLNLGAVGEGYSISFWFKDDSKPSSERQILGKGGRSGPAPFIFRLDQSGRVSFRISDGFQASTIESDSSIVSDGWRHIVGVRDISTDRIRLYVDRTETGGLVSDSTNLDLSNTLDVFFNKYDAGTAFFYDRFSLDDVRIYKHALSGEEILSLYSEGKGL